MIRPSTSAILNFSVTLLMASQVALSADNTTLTITAKPGKTMCQSKDQKLGELLTKIELCVTQGSFSHDTYLLKIGGNTILKGIDDETTKGLSSTYRAEKVQLTCVPKHETPTEVSPEKIAAVQSMMPNLSPEDAKKTAILMERVEVGRSCSAQLANNSLIEVLIIFE